MIRNFSKKQNLAKTPLYKSVAMDLDHQLNKFLPLIISHVGLPKLKVVESTILRSCGGRLTNYPLSSFGSHVLHTLLCIDDVTGLYCMPSTVLMMHLLRTDCVTHMC